jgi:hypothetical protein
MRKALGDEHPHTLNTLFNFAGLLHKQGQFNEAEKLYREELDGIRKALGATDRSIRVQVLLESVLLCAAAGLLGAASPPAARPLSGQFSVSPTAGPPPGRGSAAAWLASRGPVAAKPSRAMAAKLTPGWGGARGGAEIITLHPDKHRSRAPTPNDPPNVPIDEHIGRHLKAIYDDVLNQPIPGRFLDLLNQLGDEPSKDEDAS